MSEGDDRPRPRLPRTVIALGLTSLFTDVGTEMVFPLLPVFLVSLGAGPAFLGVLEGFADATAAALKYLSGRWADRLPRKKPLVLLGYSLSGLVRPLMALAGAPWHVLAVRVTDRIGKGIRTSPRDVLIASSVDAKDAGRAFGLHSAMDHAGAVIGPLLATALLAFGLELRTIFAITFIPGVLAVLSIIIIREPPAPVPAPRDTQPAAPLDRRLMSLLAIFTLFALGNSSDAFLLLRAKDVGVPQAQLPLLWMTLNLSRVGWAWAGGKSSDRVSRTALINAGWLVFAVSYLGFAWATQPAQLWALFIFYGAFTGLTEPVEKALLKQLAPETSRGRIFGLYNGLLGAASIPAGLLTGALWQQFGPHVALSTSAGIAGVCVVTLLVWQTMGRHTSVR